MIRKKYGVLMLVSIILLAGILTYQLFFDYQMQSINEDLQNNPSAAGERAFRNFDATQFVDQHLWLGDKVPVIYENQLLGASAGVNNPPQEAQIKKVLSTYTGADRLIMGMQSWIIMSNGQPDVLAKKHIDWYLQTLAWAKQVLPQTDIGFVIPANDLVSDGLPLLAPIIRASDSFYPTFDVANDDFDKMKFTMTDAIFIAKSLLKPVYPFMWHRGSGGSYQGKTLPDTVIEQQCKFVRASADGVVWWSGAGESWNGGVWYPAAADCFK